MWSYHLHTLLLGTSLLVPATLTPTWNPSQSIASASNDDFRVVNGTKSEECAWPPVVQIGTEDPDGDPGLKYGICSGALIHPRVVLYASHCDVPLRVSVGNDRHEPIKITEFEKFGNHKGWSEPNMNTSAVDWGYAVLKEPIPGATVIPLAYGCELEELQQVGNPIHLVGYSDNKGQHEAADPDNFVQRWAPAKILGLKGGILTVGGEGTGVRRADSGSPVLAQTKDGSWRSLGVVSRQNGYSAAVRKELVDWLIKETGIDVTPCFDSDGNPTEGKECDAFRAFAGDPKKPVGKVEEACKGAPTNWAGLACGLKKSDGSDPEDEPGEDGSGEDSSNEDSDSMDGGTDDSQSSDDTSSEGDSSTDKEPKDSEDGEGSNSGEDSSDTKAKKPKDNKKKKNTEDDDSGSDGDSSDEDEEENGANNGKGAKGCSLASGDNPWTGLVASFAIALFWRRRRQV